MWIKLLKEIRTSAKTYKPGTIFLTKSSAYITNDGDDNYAEQFSMLTVEDRSDRSVLILHHTSEGTLFVECEAPRESELHLIA